MLMIEMAKYVQQGIEVGCNLQRLCPMTLCVTRWPVSPGSSTDTLSQRTQPQCATLKSHSTRPLYGTEANSFSHFSQHTHCTKQVRKNCSPAKKSNMDIVFSHHEAITRCLPLRPSCNVLEVPVEGSARYCAPLRWDWEGGGGSDLRPRTIRDRPPGGDQYTPPTPSATYTPHHPRSQPQLRIRGKSIFSSIASFGFQQLWHGEKLKGSFLVL